MLNVACLALTKAGIFTSCGHIRISYNSCRNRHCPKCQVKFFVQAVKLCASSLHRPLVLNTYGDPLLCFKLIRGPVYLVIDQDKYH